MRVSWFTTIRSVSLRTRVAAEQQQIDATSSSGIRQTMRLPWARAAMRDAADTAQARLKGKRLRGCSATSALSNRTCGARSSPGGTCARRASTERQIAHDRLLLPYRDPRRRVIRLLLRLLRRRGTATSKLADDVLVQHGPRVLRVDGAELLGGVLACARASEARGTRDAMQTTECLEPR